MEIFHPSRKFVDLSSANQPRGSLPRDLGLTLPSLETFRIHSNQSSGLIPSTIPDASTNSLLDLGTSNFIGKAPTLTGQIPRFLACSPWMCRLITLKLFQATDGFSSSNLIGAGSFGSVYRRILASDGAAVAVKVFNIYVKELQISDEPHEARNLNLIQRSCISVDVAAALDSLHRDCQIPVVHFDLKPTDVLLDCDIYDCSWSCPKVSLRSSSIQSFTSLAQVICGRKHRRVVELDLHSSQLAGSLSPHIGNLSFLRILNLEINSFSYLIPQELGRLFRIQELSLGNNTFSGEIPANISRCTNLLSIGLGSNNLTGKLPAELGSLSKLQVFNFQHNHLSGEIPSSYGNLSELESILGVRNNLQGGIPDSIAQLKRLTVFKFGVNSLSGTIPSSMYNMSSLVSFSAPLNKLYGILPPELGITLPNLETFNIHGNQFRGLIPSTLSNASKISDLQLRNNSFTGKVPSLAGLHNLQKLVLNFNNLGNNEDDDLGFLYTLANTTTLDVLAINHNNFGGVLPEIVGNFSEKLRIMVIGENNLRGSIPTEIGNLIGLDTLGLELNHLTGIIPSSIGKLQRLGVFDINGNKISGNIPSSLGNITSLLEVYFFANNLQGRIPSSLGNCQNLLLLLLHQNNLSGSIPKEVLGVSSLSLYLDLSENQLTGPLPSEVGKLVSLGGLNVNKNKLSGEIPRTLGSCVSLEYLYMEGNLFQGPIPESLSSLRALQDLNLSHNNLSGGIPKFLAEYKLLKSLDLSFNDLGGEVPVQGVFASASGFSISGNKELCGGIPQLNLSRCTTSKKSEKLKSSTKQKLIIAIPCGFVGIILLVSSILFFFPREKKSRPASSSPWETTFQRVSYEELLQATSGFSSANLIGAGSFGSVYKGILASDHGEAVAVKVFNLLREGASKSFMAECAALINIRHRNLVRVLTACSGIDFQGNDFKALVYEFMVNGSLEEWLHPVPISDEPHRRRALSLIQRLNIAIDMASALDYLHNHCQIAVVHCDLKPSNVLLDADMTAHVGDFGLARLLPQASHQPCLDQTSSIGLRGTVGYAAPEYGLGNEVSPYGDVYSFGILLLEVFTGRRPTDGLFKDELNLHNFAKMALPVSVAEVVDPVLVTEAEETSGDASRRMSHVENHMECLAAIVKVGVACSAESPSERMEISSVSAELHRIRNILMGPQTHGQRGIISAPEGVICGRKHRRVVELDLHSSQLAGSLSPHIGNLSFLRILNLEINSFSYVIPQELGRLFRIQELSLGNNTFSGEIPANISRCTNLLSIGLGSNNLTGKLPAELGSLSKLQVFNFQHNHLSGEIPSSYGNLSELESILGVRNNLQGGIPDSIAQLKRLTGFKFGVNSLSGTIPSSMYNMSSLVSFSAPLNKLYGILPPELGITLPNLDTFNIHSNQFRGLIPSTLSNASKISDLQLRNNSFTGKVPSLAGLHNLQKLLLDFNNLGNNEDDDLGFLYTLANTTTLEVLAINDNNFGGVLPAIVGNFSEKLRIMIIGGNNLRGSIPTEIGNLIGLDTLGLELNQLTGSIPSSIGKLQRLSVFNINGNKISGNIPSSLGNITSLLEVYFFANNLQGRIPSSLGNCQNLLSLLLHQNNLSGSIPKEVLGVSSLSLYLDLSENQLTGPLPSEVGKLVNLGGLNVNKNKLSGEIPRTLGSCVSLEYLYMEGNLFQGPIPESLSSLRALQDLNLSHNNLSGGIPKFLAEYKLLKSLDLSFNDLGGELPVQGVFASASGFSISGNKELCGGIPQLNLSRCTTSKKSEKLKSSTKQKLIIAIPCGFVGIILLISSILFFFPREKKSRPASSSPWETTFQRVSYEELLQATSGFSPANLIGAGSFGSVYKGILASDHGEAVAVKVFNLLREGASKSFMAECAALINIRHRNLVKVLTACSGIDFQGNDFKALVYEFMVNGSLEEWLHPVPISDEPHRRRDLSLLQRLNIAIDVASALDYLHNHCQIAVVHCDLKPSNVLLDADMTAHVGDFGLARVLPQASHQPCLDQTSSIGLRGTVGYAAPEYGLGNEVSPYGDVYSFGILLLEVFTGRRPTDGLFKDELNLHNFAKMALPVSVAEVVDPVLVTEAEETSGDASRRMSHVENHMECLAAIVKVGVACSAESPSERMEISSVSAELHRIRNILMGPQTHGQRGIISAPEDELNSVSMNLRMEYLYQLKTDGGPDLADDAQANLMRYVFN
uniref:non-specific serine/threonine protein kinase n=1 Tax=Salix viminalis TaxID=40686 RepID=A0A6N2LQT1_SALVM